MRYLAILSLLFFVTGCAYTSPYGEVRAEYQINSWSDWVLQPEREWTPERDEMRLHLQAGLQWKNGWECPFVDTMITGPWDQMFIGCSKTFGWKRSYVSALLMHQVDERTSEFLRTDQKQWQGHNPFLHVRAGFSWKDDKYRCPGIATGKSLFQGAPFEQEEGEPDLYWTTVTCAVRFGGLK